MCEAVRRKATRAASERGEGDEGDEGAEDDRETSAGRRERSVEGRWVKAGQSARAGRSDCNTQKARRTTADDVREVQIPLELKGRLGDGELRLQVEDPTAARGRVRDDRRRQAAAAVAVMAAWR